MTRAFLFELLLVAVLGVALIALGPVALAPATRLLLLVQRSIGNADDAQALVLLACLAVSAPVISIWAANRFVPKLFEYVQFRLLQPAKPENAAVPSSLARVTAFTIFLPLFATPALMVLVAIGGKALGQVAMGIGCFCLIYASVYNRIPNHRRDTKYFAYFIGSSFVVAAPSGLVGDISPISLTLWLVNAASTSCLYVVFQRRLRPRQPLFADSHALAAFRWYRWCMSFGPGPGFATILWTVARVIPVVGDLFWVARICAKEKLSHAPVLFLRSFNSDVAAQNLTKGVIPAVSSRCVMSALVHQAQPGSRLNRMIHSAWTPTTVAVIDSEWQGWIVAQLRTAFAVVLDATMLSAATRWELEQATQIVGCDAVAVLVKSGQRGDFCNAVVFEYDEHEIARIQPALESWLDGVIDQRFRRPAAAAVSFAA